MVDTRQDTRTARKTSPVTTTGVDQDHGNNTPVLAAMPNLTNGNTASHQSSPASFLSHFEEDINLLSEEGKTIVRILLKAMNNMSDSKDQTIKQMQTKIEKLENSVIQLQDQLDDVNQYERRDTIIVGGSALAQEIPNENSAEVIVRTIKDQLKINITQNDINVAHRIGNSTKRPIIVKLHSRQKKEDIMSACITIKPNLHINESLTPKRRALFKQIWEIRKNNRELFQQCYTKDGKICVKLKCSNLKQIITNEEALSKFLDKFPILRNTPNAQIL